MTLEDLKPGQRVRVVQIIDRRAGDWQAPVVGVIRSVEQGKTGSWYAHSKDEKLWLTRVRLVKDDGEESVLNLDVNSRIELAPAP